VVKIPKLPGIQLPKHPVVKIPKLQVNCFTRLTRHFHLPIELYQICLLLLTHSIFMIPLVQLKLFTPNCLMVILIEVKHPLPS
jgi:hypothetical protein